MKLELQIGSKILKKDGQPIEMDVAPFTQDDRTFVPIRFVAENLGFTVGWDEEIHTVTITDEKPSKHKSRFETIEECAIDFAMCYNPLSIGIGKEISAVITKDDGGYYYTNVYVGTETQNVIQKKGIEHISDIHTHGNAKGYKAWDSFSSSDKKSSIRDGVDTFIASPFGTVKKYLVESGKTITVSTDVPFDTSEYEMISKQYPDVAKNIAYYKEYFGNVIPSIDAEDNKYTTEYLKWKYDADKYVKEFWNKAVIL